VALEEGIKAKQGKKLVEEIRHPLTLPLPLRGERVTEKSFSPSRWERVTEMTPSPSRWERVTEITLSPSQGERVG
jgi:hypothetical protein